MNILKHFLPFVNPLFRSKLFLLVIIGGLLLFALVKFNPSKLVELVKVLGNLGANILAIFLSLAVSPFIKTFQDMEDHNG